MDLNEHIRVSRELKGEAKIFLDRYSYEEIIDACECGKGEPVLMEYLHNIFVSIIEDWIQDYVDKRKRRYLRRLRSEISVHSVSGDSHLEESVDLLTEMMDNL